MSVLAFLLASAMLAGCGGSPDGASPGDQAEGGDRAKGPETTAEETTSSMEGSAGNGPPECDDFATPEDANAALYAQASPEESRAAVRTLDPDLDGYACDEPGNETRGGATPTPEEPPGAAEMGEYTGDQYGDGERAPIEALPCQTREVRQEAGPGEYQALSKEWLDTVMTMSDKEFENAPTFEEFLAERGYTCGGRVE